MAVPILSDAFSRVLAIDVWKDSRQPLDIENMGERAIATVRCDGEKIEMLLFDDTRLFINKIDPEKALRLAHDLLGFAMQMMGKTSDG